MQYIALDAHKRYSFASAESLYGTQRSEARVEHAPGAIRRYLGKFEPGSPVAVETVGNWYWIISEIEEAGMVPQLVHAYKAKMMLATVNKTDRLDARGMNRLQRCGTLPTVWIPPGPLRDQRELFRTRMVLTQQRTRLKNRIHATLAKYGLRIEQSSDAFGKKGRQELLQCVTSLPVHTRHAVECLLAQLDSVIDQIARLESRMQEVFAPTEAIGLLKSLPGVGFILAVVIFSEVGAVERFASASHFASYAGTAPRVHASGGKVRLGQLRSDVNRYLKWAFIEAANVISSHRRRYPHRHVTRLYERVRSHRGHQTAVGAVARHLAESTYWMLKERGTILRTESRHDFVHEEISARGVMSSPEARLLIATSLRDIIMPQVEGEDMTSTKRAVG
jgi:transposase